MAASGRLGTTISLSVITCGRTNRKKDQTQGIDSQDSHWATPPTPQGQIYSLALAGSSWQGPGDISESPVSGKANVLILSTTHIFLLSCSFTVGLLLLLQDPQSPWLKWNGIVGSLQTMNFISLVSVQDLPQKLETYLQGTLDQYSCAGLWCSGLKSFSLESGALTIRKSKWIFRSLCLSETCGLVYRDVLHLELPHSPNSSVSTWPPTFKAPPFCPSISLCSPPNLGLWSMALFIILCVYFHLSTQDLLCISEYLCELHVYKRGGQIPCNWSYTFTSFLVWLLGTKPIAAWPLLHTAISPVPF